MDQKSIHGEVEAWAEEVGLELNDAGNIEAKWNQSIEFTGDRVVVMKDGGMALQGELVDVNLEGSFPALIVEGERHAWDVDGPVRWEGSFAVMAEWGGLDIDGPLPE